MPCVCEDPYEGRDLVHFSCGHVIHSECASMHVAHRISNNDNPSCPVCNANGESEGRTFLNFGAEDVEQYLINHPDVFRNLVNQHQAVIYPNQNLEVHQQNEVQEHTQNGIEHVGDNQLHHNADEDENEDGGIYVDAYGIPLLGVEFQVVPVGFLVGFLFTSIPTELMDDDEHEDDDHVENRDDEIDDFYYVAPINMNMRVGPHRILMTSRQLDIARGEQRFNDVLRFGDETEDNEDWIEDHDFVVRRFGIGIRVTQQGLLFTSIRAEMVDQDPIQEYIVSLALRLRINQDGISLSDH